MRQRYGKRAAFFERECHSQLAGLLRVEPITTGLDATALLAAGSDDRSVAMTLEQCGVEARPISFYHLQQSAPPGLVMCFSSFDEEAIRRGVAAMAPVLETLLKQ